MASTKIKVFDLKTPKGQKATMYSNVPSKTETCSVCAFTKEGSDKFGPFACFACQAFFRLLTAELFANGKIKACRQGPIPSFMSWFPPICHPHEFQICPTCRYGACLQQGMEIKKLLTQERNPKPAMEEVTIEIEEQLDNIGQVPIILLENQSDHNVQIHVKPIPSPCSEGCFLCNGHNPHDHSRNNDQQFQERPMILNNNMAPEIATIFVDESPLVPIGRPRTRLTSTSRYKKKSKRSLLRAQDNQRPKRSKKSKKVEVANPILPENLNFDMTSGSRDAMVSQGSPQQQQEQQQREEKPQQNSVEEDINDILNEMLPPSHQFAEEMFDPNFFQGVPNDPLFPEFQV